MAETFHLIEAIRAAAPDLSLPVARAAALNVQKVIQADSATGDEAGRYLDVTQAAKQTSTVAAVALLQSAGDAADAIRRLEQMRPLHANAGVAFAGDVISVAQQSIREAEAIQAEEGE